MHPIEHLRYVARAGGGDVASLAREAAIALGTLRADPANLVIACRRIVERQPEAGPLWWMCAHLLTSDDPSRLAWELADSLEDDPTVRHLSATIPQGATVATVGWPAVAAEAIARRGDVRVLSADSRFEASGFVRHLERCDIEVEIVPGEALARATAAADVALVEALAVGSRGALVTLGAHVLASVARGVGTPVWLVAGVGRRLPDDYVAEILARTRPSDGEWDVDHDELPLDLVDRVVTTAGASPPGAERAVADAVVPECPFAPELLRTSPF